MIAFPAPSSFSPAEIESEQTITLPVMVLSDSCLLKLAFPPVSSTKPISESTIPYESASAVIKSSMRFDRCTMSSLQLPRLFFIDGLYSNENMNFKSFDRYSTAVILDRKRVTVRNSQMRIFHRKESGNFSHLKDISLGHTIFLWTAKIVVA